MMYFLAILIWIDIILHFDIYIFIRITTSCIIVFIVIDNYAFGAILKSRDYVTLGNYLH